MTVAPTWSILIPTLGERRAQFERLMGALLPQIDRHPGRVRVIGWFNNGEPSLPEIRQRMVQNVTTDYLSFVDDDDSLPPYFVDEVLSALDGRPDYVGWQTHYFANGRDHGLVDHSLRHGGWREEKHPYALLRDISHINPMRTDVAQRADFRVAARGQVEDHPWADQIRATGLLKVETYIPRPMYEYRWSRTGSRWRRPSEIRTVNQRPAVDHPALTWLDQQTLPALDDLVSTPIAQTTGSGLLVLIPTRGRPDNIRRVIGAWDSTNAWDHADMWLIVDADDPERDAYYALEDGAVSPMRIAEVSSWRPMVHKLDEVAAEVATLGRYFALGFAGDDHLPQTIGWAKTYLDELHRLGTGMVYGNDGYQGKNLATQWAVTTDAVRALGRMVPAPVEHMYCDNAIMEVFSRAGALTYLPEVKIEHRHPVAGKAPTDAQYQRVNSRDQFSRDRKAYEAWQRRTRAGQVSKIVALRGGRPVPRERPTMSRTIARIFPLPFKQVKGLTPDEIGVTLADFASVVPADQAIVELGVHHGRTALQMAWGARQGNRAHIWAIDPWDTEGNVYTGELELGSARNWARYNVRSLGYSNDVTLIQGFGHDEAATWSGPAVGLLYVDGDHTAEGARRDIETWAPHLAPGAIIAVDDYLNENYPGVAEAVDALVAEGVLDAVELFHDRLAVTRMAADPAPSADPVPPAAPEPEPLPDTFPDEVDDAFASDTEVSNDWAWKVTPREAIEVNLPLGPVADLNTVQLRALARARGIVLGARKDKRDEMLAALKAGQ